MPLISSFYHKALGPEILRETLGTSWDTRKALRKSSLRRDDHREEYIKVAEVGYVQSLIDKGWTPKEIRTIGPYDYCGYDVLIETVYYIMYDSSAMIRMFESWPNYMRAEICNSRIDKTKKGWKNKIDHRFNPRACELCIRNEMDGEHHGISYKKALMIQEWVDKNNLRFVF